jgi:zearalenone synthase (highly reducing iterative type I polyketide synthase)
LFDYTVASSNTEWLKSAEEHLAASNLRSKFTSVDWEKPVENQGLVQGSFDLVLGSVRAGDGQDIQTLLKQLSKLAKAGARICLIEDIPEDSESDVALHSKEQWQGLLQSYGLQVQFTSSTLKSSLTVGNVPSTENETVVADEIIILEGTNPTPASQALAAEISDRLQAASIASTRMILADPLANLKGKRCISLLELESSILEDLSQGGFESVKEIILSASNLLWFVGFKGPAASLITGLARSIRNEIAGLELCTLLAPVSAFESQSALVSAIITVATSSIRDNELRAENGVLQVSRLVEEEALSNAIAGLQRGEKVLTPLSQTVRPQKLVIQNPGLLDSLCFELDGSLEKELGDDEIEIEVRASGVK